MFCSNCKTEYRSGFLRCSDCGAPLVEHLEATLDTHHPPGENRPELLWSGTDPAVWGVIVQALKDSGIPHHESHRDLGPIPGLSQPVYAVFIPSAHHQAASAAMEKALHEFENGAEQADGSITPSESSSPETVFSEEDENGAPAPDDIPQN
jgi:hypothetical protein